MPSLSLLNFACRYCGKVGRKACRLAGILPPKFPKYSYQARIRNFLLKHSEKCIVIVSIVEDYIVKLTLAITK